MASSHDVKPAARNATTRGTGTQRYSTKSDLERAAFLIALRRLIARAEIEALPAAAALLRQIAEHAGQASASTAAYGSGAAGFSARAAHHDQD